MLIRHAIAPLLAAALATGPAAQGLWIPPDTSAPPHPMSHPVPAHPVPPHPAIRALSLRVRTAITDGVATTEVRQVFRNDGDRMGEGTWILPLPLGAAADRFTMSCGGKEVPGEVLGADRARGIYESIVRQQRDPGLLEYYGTGCLRARVFPIPPRGEIEVLVRFRQVLPEAAGIHTWTYPLRAAGAQGQAPDRTSLDLTIRSKTPLKSVYSPLAQAEITRQSDYEARVTLELGRGQLPERDLTVLYGLSEHDVGLHVLTYRRTGEAGWFLMMLAPKVDWPEPEHTAKAITFVIDTSGSMQGKKLEQAREALRFFVGSLRPHDSFNVVPFSTEARPFFAAPVAATPDNLEIARRKAGELEARGGTNIEDAMRAALVAPAAVAPAGTTLLPITVLLTDGCPTVGQTDVDRLLASVAAQNGSRARIFVFGVGNDVNTRLLDRIAADSRGDRDYVREDESIEIKTGALFTKLSHPVMTGVEVTCAGIDGYDTFPARAPDLFKGSRLLIVGRYRGDGHHAVRVKGTVDGVARELVFEASFTAADTAHDFVPVLWAERKIGFLLDQIRLNGTSVELVDEVTRLGKEFGIVTPFTSHLIVEEGERLARARGLDPRHGAAQWLGDVPAESERVRRDLGRAGVLPGAAAPPAAAVEQAIGAVEEAAKVARGKMGELHMREEGDGAVDNSVALKGFATAARPTRTDWYAGGDAARLIHRRVGDRAFYLAGGVWVDARYHAAMQDRTRRIAAFSAEYFELLALHPELARHFAFSTRIVIVIDDAAVEIS